MRSIDPLGTHACLSIIRGKPRRPACRIIPGQINIGPLSQYLILGAYSVDIGHSTKQFINPRTNSVGTSETNANVSLRHVTYSRAE